MRNSAMLLIQRSVKNQKIIIIYICFGSGILLLKNFVMFNLFSFKNRSSFVREIFFFFLNKYFVALVILYSTQFGFSQSIIKGTSWIGKCCLVIKQFLHLSYTWESLFSRMANACVVFWIKVVLNFNFQPDQLLFLKFMSFSDSQTRNIHP